MTALHCTELLCKELIILSSLFNGIITEIDYIKGMKWPRCTDCFITYFFYLLYFSSLRISKVCCLGQDKKSGTCFVFNKNFIIISMFMRWECSGLNFISPYSCQWAVLMKSYIIVIKLWVFLMFAKLNRFLVKSLLQIMSLSRSRLE